MDARVQRRVQRYGWDKAAAPYDRRWEPLLRPAHQALLRRLDPKPGDRVLDVACGTGFLTVPLGRAVGSNGTVVATDLSEAMTQATADRARSAGLTNIEAWRMDAEALDLPPQSFDAAVCALGLMFPPSPETALAEMYRVLAPGGRAAVAVWGERARCGWADVFEIVDQHVASEVCPLFFRLGAGDTLARIMGEVGFAPVESERVAVTLEVPDPEAALETFLAGSAVALAYDRFDATTRTEVDRSFLNAIADYRHGEGYAIPAEFVVASGSRRR